MIDFYSAPTPNGYKVAIALEEMGLPYELHAIELSENEQKSPDFLKINPNGRIPAIVDHEANHFAVFESGAILIYLADKTGQFLAADPLKQSLALQWLMFQMAGVGPMMGQANVFMHYFPEKLPGAIERYRNESLRLLEVLDKHLAGRDFLAGDYSIADMATWPWARLYSRLDLDISGLVHLQRWLDAIADRPAVQRAVQVPPSYSDEERLKRAQKIVTR